METSTPPTALTPSMPRIAARWAPRGIALLALVLVVGNGLILGLSLWFRTNTDINHLDIAGVRKAVAVDRDVWRGAAPSAKGYRSLAAVGVSTVVDLRSDSERGPAVEALEGLDVETVRLPIRDGQLPTDEEVAAFLAVVDSAPGIVFVHCGAGVGRTGAMVAAYQAAGGKSAPETVRRNLAVGPPSLEQIAFAAAGGESPWVGVTAVSRVLDGPRRIWHNVT